MTTARLPPPLIAETPFAATRTLQLVSTQTPLITVIGLD